MGDDQDLGILPEKWYSASEAAPYLMLKELTLKKKLREKQISGKQVGPKKVWHIQGKAILKLRDEWNLDGV